MPVGTVRADFSQGTWKLSWTVAPAARRHGVAKQMVALLSQQISAPIRAEIKADNLASVKIAKHAGMVFSQKVKDMLHYSRKALTW